jgi:signal peptidase II
MAMRSSRRAMSKTRLLLTIALPLLLADCATKRVAVERLEPANAPHNVIGSTVRLTLAYNRRGAMGLPAGPYPRWVLAGITILGLLVLARLLRTTPPRARARGIGLALLLGGATGNLLSRLSDPRGVVDFLDIGVAGWRFWTFNVADIGITCGALLLAWVLWRSGSRARGARPTAGDAT